ncbi:MAG: DMT family transporter [Nanoarchaeota archaeon]
MKTKGLFYILTFSFFWAVEIILLRLGLKQGAEPVSFLFQIVVFSFLFLCIWNLGNIKNLAKAKGNLKKIALIGIFGTGLGNIIGYYGLKYSTAVNYGFIVKTSLIFTVFLAFIFLKEPLHKEKIILMIILLIGVYLISTKGTLIIPRIGDLLIVVSAFFYSSQAVISKHVLKKVPPAILANLRLFFGALFILPFAYIFNKDLFHIDNLSLVIAIAVSMALALIFLYKTLEIRSASYMTLMNMTTPVIVAVLSIIFLDELMNLYQVLGGALIILSGLLIHKVDI